MATAWQKAMRAGTTRRARLRLVESIIEIRPGTYEAQIDTGSGVIPVRRYPDGTFSSGLRRFSDSEIAALAMIFSKSSP